MPSYNRGMKPDVRWSPELWRYLCEQLAGGRSLKKICEEPGMPTRQAVSMWIASNRELADEYFAARRAGSLCWADDIVDLSDESRGLDMAGVQSHRLSVDSRRWLLSKLHPEMYGDRIEHQHMHASVRISLPRKPGEAVAASPPNVLFYDPADDGSE